MTDWYYADAQNQRHGPLPASDLAALHAQGVLRPETLVWREGLAAWTPWRQVMQEVVPPTPAAAGAPPVPPPASDDASPYAPPRAALHDDSAVVAGNPEGRGALLLAAKHLRLEGNFVAGKGDGPMRVVFLESKAVLAELKKVNEEYEKKFGRIPSQYAAQSYDAALLLDSAIGQQRAHIGLRHADCSHATSATG